MDTGTIDEQEKKDHLGRRFFLFSTAVFLIWGIYASFLFWGQNIKFDPDFLRAHRETVGVFGDYFGALNALFAGLAFAGLIVTILQQREDLKETKREMKNQTDQFIRQSTIDKLAGFENSLFRKIEILERKHAAVVFIEEIKGEQITCTGIIAWLKIQNVTVLTIRNSMHQPISDTQMENIVSNNLHSYISVHTWFNYFANIARDILDFNLFSNDEENSAMSKKYMEMLLSTLVSYEKEHICFFLNLHQSDEKYNRLKKYLFDNKFLNPEEDKYRECFYDPTYQHGIFKAINKCMPK